MKIKMSRYKFKKWLKSAAGITLLSISITGNIATVISNTQSLNFWSKAMEQKPEAFPKGMYVVEYERSENDGENITYFRTIWAMAYDASVAGGGKILHLSALLHDIADSEYIVFSNDETGAYKLTSIIVKQPENPIELEELLIALNRHASFVAVEDGSGEISGANSFINGRKFC